MRCVRPMRWPKQALITTGNPSSRNNAPISGLLPLTPAMAVPVIRDPKGNLRACADVHISNSGRTPAVGFYMTRLATYGEKTTPYVECDRKARDVIMSLKVPPYERPTGGMLGVTGDKWVRQQLISSTRPLSKKSLMANDPSTCTESFGISIFLGIITKPVFAVLNSQVARRTHLPTCLFGNWMDKRTR